MKQFSELKTVKQNNNTTLVQVNSADKIVILSLAKVEVNHTQYLNIDGKKMAEAIIEVLTSYVQYENGQTTLDLK